MASENEVLINSAAAFTSALPGGNRNNDGTFNNMGNNANFWSSSENDANNAWNRNLNYDNADINRNNNNKQNGFSVRLVRDETRPVGYRAVFALKQETAR